VDKEDDNEVILL